MYIINSSRKNEQKVFVHACITSFVKSLKHFCRIPLFHLTLKLTNIYVLCMVVHAILFRWKHALHIYVHIYDFKFWIPVLWWEYLVYLYPYFCLCICLHIHSCYSLSLSLSHSINQRKNEASLTTNTLLIVTT